MLSVSQFASRVRTAVGAGFRVENVNGLICVTRDGARAEPAGPEFPGTFGVRGIVLAVLDDTGPDGFCPLVVEPALIESDRGGRLTDSVVCVRGLPDGVEFPDVRCRFYLTGDADEPDGVFPAVDNRTAERIANAVRDVCP